MSQNKMIPTTQPVATFIAELDEPRRSQMEQLVSLFAKATQEKAIVWGGNIIGFGSYHYRYASGREGDAPRVGLSPRKQAITLYLNLESEAVTSLLAGLGAFTRSKACVYIKRLEDIDQSVLHELVEQSYVETTDFNADR